MVSEMKDTRLRMVESLSIADVIINSANEDVAKKVMETTGGRGPDVVIEAAGSNVTVKQAFEMLGKSGRVVLVGLPTKPTDIDTTRDITYKEADVRGTTGRLMYQTWDRMSRIIAYKRIDLKRVITHRFSLDRVEEGFKSIIEGKACKVIVIP
jgi:threonine 3-dehydrogenase